MYSHGLNIYSHGYPVDPKFNIILVTGMQAMIDLDLYQSGDSGNCIFTEVIIIAYRQRQIASHCRQI